MPAAVIVKQPTRDRSNLKLAFCLQLCAGVVKVMDTEQGKVVKGGKNKSMFLLYIEGNHVVNARSTGSNMAGKNRAESNEKAAAAVFTPR